MLLILLLLAILVLPIVVVVYFLPTLIAVYRQHHNRVAIFILNLLFGWTFIGWGLALVWSATKVWPSTWR